MLPDSQDINDCVFALGAMAHYAGDNNGHRLAASLMAAMLYLKPKGKYGSAATYRDNPIARIKTEFGFDVLEVRKVRSERAIRISGPASC